MAQAQSMFRRFESPEAVQARLAQVDLGEAARPIAASGGTDLAAAVRELVAAGLTGDAVSVLAQALEKRAAVWWACRAARLAPKPAPGDLGEATRAADPPEIPPLEAAALAAAEAWVRSPDETKAHAAFKAAQAADVASPAACAALAAFFAADSIAPVGGQAVPPPEHVVGIVAAGAVQLAAVRHRPDIAPQTLATFIDHGFAIAVSHQPWEN